MRTIPNVCLQLEKTHKLILTKFIPVVTGGIYVNQVERYLLLLPAKYGGLGIPIFSELIGIEFQNSQIMSEDLRNKIIQQEKVSNSTITQFCKDSKMICPMNSNG